MSKFVHRIGEGARFPFEITKKKEVDNTGEYIYCNHREGHPRLNKIVCKGCKILECGLNPNREGEKTMAKENNKNGKVMDLNAVMDKLEAIETMIKNLSVNIEVGGEAKPAAKVKETTGKGKLSKKEKDAVKAELLKNGPYGSKEKLVELGTKRCRQYASALGLNVFGKGVEEVQKMILAAEKPKKKAQKKAETGAKK